MLGTPAHWYAVGIFSAWVLLTTAMLSFGPQTAAAYLASGRVGLTYAPALSMPGRLAWTLGVGILAALWLTFWVELAAGKI